MSKPTYIAEDVETLSQLFSDTADWILSSPGLADEDQHSFAKLMHVVLTCYGRKSLRYLANESEDFLINSGIPEPRGNAQISEARIDAKFASALKQLILNFADAFDEIEKARHEELRENDSRHKGV